MYWINYGMPPPVVSCVLRVKLLNASLQVQYQLLYYVVAKINSPTCIAHTGIGVHIFLKSRLLTMGEAHTRESISGESRGSHYYDEKGEEQNPSQERRPSFVPYVLYMPPSAEL